MCTTNSEGLESLGLALDALLLVKGLRAGKMPQKSEEETTKAIEKAIGESVRMLEIYREGRLEPIFGWSDMYDTLAKIDVLRKTAAYYGEAQTIDELRNWDQSEDAKQFALRFFRSLNSSALHVVNHP